MPSIKRVHLPLPVIIAGLYKRKRKKEKDEKLTRKEGRKNATSLISVGSPIVSSSLLYESNRGGGAGRIGRTLLAYNRGWITALTPRVEKSSEHRDRATSR